MLVQVPIIFVPGIRSFVLPGHTDFHAVACILYIVVDKFHLTYIDSYMCLPDLW